MADQGDRDLIEMWIYQGDTPHDACVNLLKKVISQSEIKLGYTETSEPEYQAIKDQHDTFKAYLEQFKRNKSLVTKLAAKSDTGTVIKNIRHKGHDIAIIQGPDGFVFQLDGKIYDNEQKGWDSQEEIMNAIKHMAREEKEVFHSVEASANEEMLAGYLQTALWSSTDNSNDQGGDPLDKNHDIDSIDQETLTKAEADCEAFEQKAGALLEGLDMGTVGHDFWLTRNGHGAGFWDGDYPKEIGDALTKISKEFGEVDLYVGDDGKIYSSVEVVSTADAVMVFDNGGATIDRYTVLIPNGEGGIDVYGMSNNPKSPQGFNQFNFTADDISQINLEDNEEIAFETLPPDVQKAIDERITASVTASGAPWYFLFVRLDHLRKVAEDQAEARAKLSDQLKALGYEMTGTSMGMGREDGYDWPDIDFESNKPFEEIKAEIDKLMAQYDIGPEFYELRKAGEDKQQAIETDYAAEHFDDRLAEMKEEYNEIPDVFKSALVPGKIVRLHFHRNMDHVLEYPTGGLRATIKEVSPSGILVKVPAHFANNKLLKYNDQTRETEIKLDDSQRHIFVTVPAVKGKMFLGFIHDVDTETVNSGLVWIGSMSSHAQP